MNWDNAIVTNNGLKLLQQVLEGRQLWLDYAVGGAGTAPVESLPEMSSLLDQRQVFSIIHVADVNNGKQVAGLITNLELNTGYTMTQYGVWAHIDDEPPVLLAILQDDKGLEIPSRTDIPEFHFVFFTIIDFMNSAEWKYVIDPRLMRPRLDNVDPTTTSPGGFSQLWVNINTGSLFVCIDTSGGVFTWLELKRNELTAKIGTITHKLNRYPVCNLYSTENAAGMTGAGMTGAGGENLISVPGKYELSAFDTVTVTTVAEFADCTTINQISETMFAFIPPSWSKSLLLTFN